MDKREIYKGSFRRKNVDVIGVLSRDGGGVRGQKSLLA